MKTKYYQLTGEQALAELKSSANGLTDAEVKARQEKYGPNILELYFKSSSLNSKT